MLRVAAISRAVETGRAKPQFHDMSFDRDQMKLRAAALAGKGVFIGVELEI
jgi:hypothetical protein